MIRFGELKQQTRRVIVEYGESFGVWYYVNAITPAFLASGKNIVEEIKTIVAEWEIVDQNGKNIPPAEIVDQLPTSLLSKVVEAIIADMRLSEAEKKV